MNSADLFVDITRSPDLDGSDSDWFDIASNRESDNESLSDSDHNEAGSLPPSRRSSFSIGSSADSELDSWENSASEVSDIDQESAIRRHFIPTDQAEEQRVRDALDQSMISTLSASRSNSNPSTVQNSVGDLQLSFPDPLTSSRDELAQSFEAVSTFDSTRKLVDHPAPDTTGVPAELPNTAPPAAEEVVHTPLPPLVHCNIYLYGSTGPCKWSFVHELLCKAFSDNTTPSIRAADNYTKWLTVPNGQLTFAIHDRTDGVPNAKSEQLTSDKPSLAIIYLPSDASPSFAHTYYLPILLNPLSAEKALDNLHILHIPPRQILMLSSDSTGPISISGISRLDQSQVKQAFSLIMNPATPTLVSPTLVSPKKRLIKAVHFEHFTSIQALLTLFIIVTLIVALASFRKLISPTSTPPPQVTLWGVPTSPSTVVNSTTSLSVRASTHVAIVPALNLGPTTNRGSISKSAIDAEPTKSQTWAEKMRPSTDVTLRPPSTLSNPPSLVPVQSSTIASKVAQSTVDSTSSLSLRLVDSLSEFVDATKKAFLDIVQNDELAEALEALMRAIRRQIDTVLHEYKSTTQLIRDQFIYRNDRAKGKARELKRKGQRIFSSATEELKKRTEKARQRASTVKETLLESQVEGWRTYIQTRDRLTAKGASTEKRDRDLRYRRRLKLHGHGKGDKWRRFFSVH